MKAGRATVGNALGGSAYNCAQHETPLSAEERSAEARTRTRALPETTMQVITTAPATEAVLPCAFRSCTLELCMSPR